MTEYLVHPIAEEYPPMSPHDLGRMEEDMIERGYDPRFPIVLFEGKILDGRNRYNSAKRAKVEAKFVTFKGTEDEARLFAQRANEERRHLAREWLEKRRTERIERVAKRRTEGASTRQIAAEEKVSQPQILADIKVGTDKGLSVEPKGGKVTGQDGKHRAAKKPAPPDNGKPAERRSSTPEPQQPEYDDVQRHPDDEPQREPAESPAQESAPVAVDQVGAPIPEALADVFDPSFNLKAKEAISALRKAADLIDELAKMPGGRQLMMHLSRENPNKREVRYRSKDLQNALYEVQNWRPYSAHCPYCVEAGKISNDCLACFGCGWTCKDAFERAPRDLQATIKLMSYPQEATS